MSVTPAVSVPPKARRPWRRRLVRLALLPAAGYLGVIVVLLALENYLLFHPTRAADGWFAPPDPRVQDVSLTSADGTPIHAWWYPRAGADGAVLYCHGNAGNLSHRGARLVNWHDLLNQSVLIFDYPGYGKSGGKPSEAGCYAAAAAAYDWLTRDAGVAPERVLLYGGSLGGGVAVETALHHPHRALVLVSTFTSVPDMAQQIYLWLPARLVRNRFDNLSKIGDCRGPVFIAHGDRDGLVPFAQGQRLFAVAPEPKAFFTMKGHDHNDAPDPFFFAALRQFLAKVEQAPAPAPN